MTEDVDILLNISCLLRSAGKLGFLEYPVSWEVLEVGAEEMEAMEEEDEGVADPALVLGVIIGAVVGSAMRLLFNLMTACLFLVEVQTNCGKAQSSRHCLLSVPLNPSLPACLGRKLSPEYSSN